MKLKLEIKMCYLMQRMHSCISATAARYFDFDTQNFRYRILKYCLNRNSVFLNLPSGIIRAFVRKMNEVSQQNGL